MQSHEEISEKISQGCRDKAGSWRFFSKAANPCFRAVLALFYFCVILELLALEMNGALAVPNPEPSLLDSNFIEPKNLQLLFRHSGKYAASTHFIYIWVPFTFSKLVLTPSLKYQKMARTIPYTG